MPARQINLIHKDDFEKKPIGKFLTWALTIGRWIVIFTELIVIIAFLSRFKLDQDLADLQASIKERQAIVSASYAFENTFRSVQNRLVKVQDLENRQIGTGKILDEISRITPNTVVLKNLTFSENIFTISGNAATENSLNLFINNLSSSSFFAETNITQVSKSSLNPGIIFSLKTRLKKNYGL